MTPTDKIARICALEIPLKNKYFRIISLNPISFGIVCMYEYFSFYTGSVTENWNLFEQSTIFEAKAVGFNHHEKKKIEFDLHDPFCWLFLPQFNYRYKTFCNAKKLVVSKVFLVEKMYMPSKHLSKHEIELIMNVWPTFVGVGRSDLDFQYLNSSQIHMVVHQF